jgi:hypothetical protein
MIRKSVKAALITAAITSSGYLSKSLGLPGFSGWAVIAVPSFVFVVMLGGGAAMRVIPRAISFRLTIIAQANDLNLMEDYRKSQVLEQLDFLWDRVFSYESDLRYSDEERAAEKTRIDADKTQIHERISQWPGEMLERLGVNADRDVDNIVMDLMAAAPLTDEMEKSREGFIISSLFALNHSLAQSSQAETIGYRLNLLEDERDGAYFDRTDTKLFEQYFGNTTIADIKKCVGFGRIEGIKNLPRKTSRRVWFHLITRKIAIETGKALKYLNDEYNTDAFNSQVLLWPGEENAKWLENLDGAREHVLRLRKTVITNTLGNDRQSACNLLDRMLLPLFIFATKLRFRYDPEYCNGSLDRRRDDTVTQNNITDDLADYGSKPKFIRKLAAGAEQAAAELAEFTDYLDARHSELADNKLALRAVKIAFHINANGIGTLFRNRSKDADFKAVDIEIEKAAKEEEQTYTNRLIACRFHQALTMLQRKGYMDLSAELAYKDD